MLYEKGMLMIPPAHFSSRSIQISHHVTFIVCCLNVSHFIVSYAYALCLSTVLVLTACLSAVLMYTGLCAGGRCVFLLEGGYDLKALGDAVVDSFLGLLGEKSSDKFSPDLLRDEPKSKVRAVLNEAKRIHDI